MRGEPIAAVNHRSGHNQGLVDLREALAASTSPHDLRLMIEQFTMNQATQQQAAPA